MKIKAFENEELWMDARLGKITGTRLEKITEKRGGAKKIGFYELIAERLCEKPDDEDPMKRGKRLEPEAIKLFAKKTKKKVNTDLVIWERDDNENIAISPDGSISNIEAVEAKCLASARHIEAYITNKIPKDYKFQTLQYFIVKDTLEILHVIFYDPLNMVKKMKCFVIKVNRKDIEKEIKEYLEYQRKVLKEVNEIVLKLTF